MMTKARKLRLTVLGSTGSIGTNTLDVVARHPDRFEVFALSGSRQVDRLFEQCMRFRPRYAVLLDQDLATLLAADRAAAPDGRTFRSIIDTEGMDGLKRARAAQWDQPWLRRRPGRD